MQFLLKPYVWNIFYMSLVFVNDSDDHIISRVGPYTQVILWQKWEVTKEDRVLIYRKFCRNIELELSFFWKMIYLFIHSSVYSFMHFSKTHIWLCHNLLKHLNLFTSAPSSTIITTIISYKLESKFNSIGLIFYPFLSTYFLTSIFANISKLHPHRFTLFSTDILMPLHMLFLFLEMIPTLLFLHDCPRKLYEQHLCSNALCSLPYNDPFNKLKLYVNVFITLIKGNMSYLFWCLQHHW